MDQCEEQQASDAGWAFIRSNSTATLKFGENMFDVTYVITPDGRLFISAMVAMLQPCDTVMYIPEYVEDCMELHVSLEHCSGAGEDGVHTDRWNVYHGEPPDVQWAFVAIDAGRFHGMFIDGESLCRNNPLAETEFSICNQLNKDPKEIARVCHETTNVQVTDPVVVGIDSLGADVRAPFGIVRIPFSAPLNSREDALSIFSTST